MKILKIPKNELKKIITVFKREVGLFVVFVFILFFDGTYFAKNILNLQIAFNILMLIAFLIMFSRAAPRIKELMIYAVIIGFVGEHFFSRVLHMYTYRLENVPIYVPLGHAVLYARILRFSKASIVKKNHKAIEQLFQIAIALFGTLYLIFFKDIFGFIMTICVFLLLWKRPKDRLFFYSMYILVAILEIGGTAFGVWKWPEIAFGVFEYLPSNNPPSGISLFYFLLDIGCFFIYIKKHNKAWFRLKNSRKIKR